MGPEYNTGIVDVTTTQLASLTITSEKSTTQAPLYPGWVGYQMITVSATGSGSTVYKLDLNVEDQSSVSAAALTALLGDVQYAACQVSNDTVAAAEADFAQHTLASAAVNSAGTQYYMENGNVALPSSCTAIVADSANDPASGTKLTSTGLKSLTASQSITAGKYDKYYIVYRYINKTEGQSADQNAAQGASFTVTPALTVLAQSAQ